MSSGVRSSGSAERMRRFECSSNRYLRETKIDAKECTSMQADAVYHGELGIKIKVKHINTMVSRSIAFCVLC